MIDDDFLEETEEVSEELSSDPEEESEEESEEVSEELQTQTVYVESPFSESDVSYIRTGVGIIAIITTVAFFTWISILVFRWLSRNIG